MILVTGGAGFIGSHFIADWLAQTAEAVVNVDSLTYAGSLANLVAVRDDARHIFVRADICDTARMAAVLTQHRPRAIVHFAAETHVDRSVQDPAVFVRTNITGTFSLLQAAHAYWNGLAPTEKDTFRFLHISTDEVYGSLAPDAPPFTEAHAYAPNSPYAASKAAADHLVRAYHHTYGLPVLTTNCSNNYGPRQFPEKLIPLMVAHAIAGAPLPVYGDGAQIRDWLHVTDHCAALRRVLEAGQPGEVYNIGGGCARSTLDVVHAITALLDTLAPRADGASYSAQIRHVQDRPGHDRRYAIDAGKIARELGWVPRETFASGLGKTVEWMLAHRDWMTAAMSQDSRTRMTANDAGRPDVPPASLANPEI